VLLWLTELRRGWAEKKMSFCERMAPHTIAARIQIPACAMGAVPIHRFSWSGRPSIWLASPLRPRSGSSSLAPRIAVAFGIPVAEAML